MYILLVVIFLLSGQKDIRTSIVEGPDAYETCRASLPLTLKLYKSGGFHDGPDRRLIRKVTGRCELVPDDEKFVKNT